MYEVSTRVCCASDACWLEERRKCVTGTDIPILFESYPEKWGVTTPEQLLEEKLIQGSFMPVKKTMWWGTEMEVPNMRAFSRLTGLSVDPDNSFYRRGVMGATTDGTVSTSNALPPLEPCWTDAFRNLAKELEELADKTGEPLGLLEMKNVSAFALKEWQKAPPRYYWEQVQGQLYVTGYAWAVLCGKIGSSDMVCHVIEVDSLFREVMLEKANEFWKEVERGSKG